MVVWVVMVHLVQTSLRKPRVLSRRFCDTISVCGKPKEKCHRFWLRLPHAVILISNDRTSASKKLNRMALIPTLTVSTTAFEITKEKFDDFRQTDLVKECCVQKLFYCLIPIKEHCVPKYEELPRSKTLGILQTETNLHCVRD